MIFFFLINQQFKNDEKLAGFFFLKNEFITLASVTSFHKMQFCANVIDENANNQRVLFLSIGKMLNLKADWKLP